MNTNLTVFSISIQPEQYEISRKCQGQLNLLLTPEHVRRSGIPRDRLIEHVAKIVVLNFVSGRARRVMLWQQSAPVMDRDSESGSQLCESADDKNDQNQIPDYELSEVYLIRVITFYLQEHERVDKLEARDNVEWARLSDQLTTRAYHILRRQTSTARAAQEATDFAQESCQAIFNRPFPYDIPFDAWATKILINCILRRYTRSQDLIDRKPDITSLDHSDQYETDDDFSLYDLLADPSGSSAFSQIEMQEWLLQAIAHLRSPAQQQVIIDTIFYDLSDEDIAHRLSKTKNAVQILRHRALQRLKQILEVKE